MQFQRTRRAIVSVLAGVMLLSVVALAPNARAQEDRYETCAAYSVIVGTGGQVGADAAARLQALGAPNPFGVDNVLEVIINGEADVPPQGSRPTADALEVAYDELAGYFGGVCVDLDICPLILQAIGSDEAVSANAARLARGITTPAPAGIGAALALIAGEIDESPFHASVTEAQAQVSSYFPCETPDGVPEAGDEVGATCGDLAVLSIPEGPFAVEAAESLQSRGAPNPPGIDAAFETLIAAARYDTPAPSADDIDAALATLDGYYGGLCREVDRCVYVETIVGTDETASAEAARLLRRIETPSPPGIDAALALIAGDIDESPFHNSAAEALEQIAGYYPCGVGTSAGGDGGATIAFTGTSATAPLAALGAGLLAAGAGVLRVRRRFDG